MWAVSSIPSPAFCPTPSTTTKSPRTHAPVTVSAKPRPLQNQNYNHFDDDEEDAIPQSVIKSNTPSVNAPPISKNPKQLTGEDIDSEVSWKSQEDMGGLSGGVVNSGNPKESSSDSEDKAAGIGGSDILWALYKASAQQKAKKTVKKREIPAAAMKDGNRKEEDYYRNVKPLRIRADWSSRLDDLERRLKELIDS